MIFNYYLCLFCIVPSLSAATEPMDHQLASRLRASTDAADTELRRIAKRWNIYEFPVFLRAAWMPIKSYNMLRDRFREAIASSSRPGASAYNLLITFTGSSVTAGHDCFFNNSYPMRVRDSMRAAVEAAGVNFEVRNVAIGNNRCIPYDVCVNVFTGGDSDIVVWEQSYDCPAHSVGSEQFIRQTLLSGGGKSTIIAFADSATPNWVKSDCEKISSAAPLLTPELSKLQTSGWQHGVKHLVTELNADNLEKFGQVSKLIEIYPRAGVQLFFHQHYLDFKCRGPYVAEWMHNNMAWHPSTLGHELRGAQMSFTWLSIWREVVSEFLNGSLPIHERKPKHASPDLPPPHTASNFVDGQQCFTDYEPRYGAKVNDTSMHRIVVSGNLDSRLLMEPDTDATVSHWRRSVWEYFKIPELSIHTTRMGYLDLKVVLYGNNYSGPISMAIEIKKQGHILFCSVPHVFNDRAANILYEELMPSKLTLFLTYLPHNATKHVKRFNFIQNKATKLDYHLGPERCIESINTVTPGRAVLTVRPARNDTKFVLLSTLVIP